MRNFPIRPAWTPLNIVLMIVGFMVFWPLGLAMIAWIVWGDRIIDRVQDAQVHRHTSRSGNDAFDEYRRAELEKLEQRRAEIDREAEEFQEFLRELRSAKDKEEFDSFLAARRGRGGPRAGEEGSVNPA